MGYNFNENSLFCAVLIATCCFFYLFAKFEMPSFLYFRSLLSSIERRKPSTALNAHSNRKTLSSQLFRFYSHDSQNDVLFLIHRDSLFEEESYRSKTIVRLKNILFHFAQLQRDTPVENHRHFYQRILRIAYNTGILFPRAAHSSSNESC